MYEATCVYVRADEDKISIEHDAHFVVDHVRPDVYTVAVCSHFEETLLRDW